LNNKSFTSMLLHYKSGEISMVDAGAGLAASGSAQPANIASASSTWVNLGEFDPTGWARLGVEAISSYVMSFRIVQGYKNSAGTFVPLSKSLTFSTLVSSAIGDALTCEVVGTWARLEGLNESGSASTVDALVIGRMVS